MKVREMIASVAVVGALLAAACDSGTPEGQATITIMTRNVYLGAEVETALDAPTPEAFLASVVESWQAIQDTKWSERVQKLAQEIADADPHVVGLQEVSTIRMQSPGDAIVGGITPATTVVNDYLDDLLSELTALGADYSVAAQNQNFDVEVPLATNPTFTEFDDIRLTDYDVLLVRGDVAFSSAANALYSIIIHAPVASGDEVTVGRGWTAATITVDGVNVRVANTHLESIAQAIRLAQGGELIQLLTAQTIPTFIIGDLNTQANANGAMYQAFLSAGYSDAWQQADGAGAGLSCCNDKTLDNATAAFDQRIDLILYRNVTDVISAEGEVTGNQAADKTTSGLWPSDHGGVVMTLTIQQ